MKKTKMDRGRAIAHPDKMMRFRKNHQKGLGKQKEDEKKRAKISKGEIRQDRDAGRDPLARKKSRGGGTTGTYREAPEKKGGLHEGKGCLMSERCKSAGLDLESPPKG